MRIDEKDLFRYDENDLKTRFAAWKAQTGGIMKYTRLTPQFVEELVFKMDPEDVGAYIAADEASWGKALSEVPGYLGGEIWEEIDAPGTVHNIIFWDKKESLTGIPKEICAKAGADFNELLSDVKVEFVEMRHQRVPMRRICCVE